MIDVLSWPSSLQIIRSRSLNTCRWFSVLWLKSVSLHVLQVSSWTGAGWPSAAPSPRRCSWSPCASCLKPPATCCPGGAGGRPRTRCASCAGRTPPWSGSALASRTPSRSRWAADGFYLCFAPCVFKSSGPAPSQGSSFHLLDLKDPGIYKPLMIGVMLMAFQQMTGINAIMFYAENIFKQANFQVPPSPLCQRNNSGSSEQIFTEPFGAQPSSRWLPWPIKFTFQLV